MCREYLKHTNVVVKDNHLKLKHETVEAPCVESTVANYH